MSLASAAQVAMACLGGAMILLVVGLVAVIVVILIAVFLSTRTGRGDEREEAGTGPGDSSRRRAGQERWAERGRDVREIERGPSAGRPSLPARRPGGGQAVPAYLERSGGREPRSWDFDEHRPPRRGERDARPEYASAPSRRTAQAAMGRGEGEGRGRYNSQPLPEVAVDDPSDGYPSMDFPSGDFPLADPVEPDFPAVRAPARSTGHDSRRKPGRAAHGDAGSKGRSRPHRGRRDDDDDWPSTDWDKLSDEQYWAEVSADKPLSSMNPPLAGSGSASAKTPPAANRPARGADAAAGPRPAKPSVTPPPARELPGRERGGDLPIRAPRGAPREAMTERLPVRPRPQRAPARAAIEAPRTPQTAPAAAAAQASASVPAISAPSSKPSTGEQGLAMLADLGTTTPGQPPARDDDPLTSPSFSRKAATDSRSYGSARARTANNSLAGLETDRKNGVGRGKHRAAQPADDLDSGMPLAAPPVQPSDPYLLTSPAAGNGTPNQSAAVTPARHQAAQHQAAQHGSGPYPAAAQHAGADGYPAAQHPSGPYPAVAQAAAAGYPPAPAAHGSNGYTPTPAAHGSDGYPAGQHPSGPYPVTRQPGGAHAHDPAGASPGSWYNIPAEGASQPVGPSYAGAAAARVANGFTVGQAPGYAPSAYHAQSAYPDPGAGSHHALPARGGYDTPAEAVTHPSFPGHEPYWDGHQAPYSAGFGNDEAADNRQADGYGGYMARG